MQFGGKTLRLKIHGHNNLFEQALFFAATPDDIGLTEQNGFVKSKPYIPTRTKSVGFQNNKELREFLIKNLHDSQKKFDERFAEQMESRKASKSSKSSKSSTTSFVSDPMDELRYGSGLVKAKDVPCAFPDDACVELRPRIICQALGSLVEVGRNGLALTHSFTHSFIHSLSLSLTRICGSFIELKMQ